MCILSRVCTLAALAGGTVELHASNLQALNLQSSPPSELKRCGVNYASIISEADCGATQPETDFPESS